MEIHELKSTPEYFEAMWQGCKPFEVRKADRDFEPGDVLRIREYALQSVHTVGKREMVTDGPHYTGREVIAFITTILDQSDHEGIREGHYVMGIEVAKKITKTYAEVNRPPRWYKRIGDAEFVGYRNALRMVRNHFEDDFAQFVHAPDADLALPAVLMGDEVIEPTPEQQAIECYATRIRRVHDFLTKQEEQCRR